MNADNLLNEVNAGDRCRPVMENILDAHVKGDYKQLLKHDSGELEKKLPLDRFINAVEKVFKPLGEVTGVTYIGGLNKKAVGPKRTQGYLLLWKVNYEKSAEDILWELLVYEHDGEIKVLGVRFL